MQASQYLEGLKDLPRGTDTMGPDGPLFPTPYFDKITGWLVDEGSCIIQPQTKAKAYRLILHGETTGKLSKDAARFLRLSVQKAIAYWTV